MKEAGAGQTGAMAALKAGPDEVNRLIHDVPEIQAANWNGPAQTVIAGPEQAVRRGLDLAAARGIAGRLLPVSSAFHTPMVASAREPFEQLAARLLARLPDCPVYSNLDAGPHPAALAGIAGRLGDHLASPVRFGEMIEAMHRAGARVFIEAGPGSVLTPLVAAVLGDRPHLALAAQPAGPGGLSGWLHTLARLAVAGIPLQLEELTRNRVARTLDLRNLPARDDPEPATASTWLVNGSRARPINEPEIKRLGQGEVLPARLPAATRQPDQPGESNPRSRPGRHGGACTLKSRWHEAPAFSGEAVHTTRNTEAHETPERTTSPERASDRGISATRCRCSWKSSARQCLPT